jgi:hypothetical protein
VTHFYALYPCMCNDVLDENPQLGIRIEHLPNERTTRAWGQVIDRRWTRRLFCLVRGACSGVRGIQSVGGLRSSPRQLLEVQAVIHDAACPDVN